jgi:hypothetical protein
MTVIVIKIHDYYTKYIVQVQRYENTSFSTYVPHFYASAL